MNAKEVPIKFICQQCNSLTRLETQNRTKDSIYDTKIQNLISGQEVPNLHTRIIKHRKKRISNFEDIIPRKKDKLHLENTDINFKRRKIKIGISHNLDMEEYYEKIENDVNLDEIDHERQDMKKVYSGIESISVDVEAYLRTARMFWNYRNLNVENELCGDFFDDLSIIFERNKQFAIENKFFLESQIRSLKLFLNFGIHLNSHFDEMALKILHICKYKKNIALYFLYKRMNPFLEGI